MKKIKICGLSRPADIETINRVKPEYCGFIINFPRSRRNVSPETVRELRSKLVPQVIPVGVFVDRPPEMIAEMLNDGTVSVAQLHGNEDEEYIANLRKLTSRPIWQAFQIHSVEDVSRAARSSADLVLLDAGQGSGKAFDWSLLDGFPREFGLAGGLNLKNLSDALKTRACLLDVSGGVETDGVKDAEKIKAFADCVRRF